MPPNFPIQLLPTALALALISASISPALAQSTPSSPTSQTPQAQVYEGRPIREVIFLLESSPTQSDPQGPTTPTKTLDPQTESLARNQVRSAVGQPYRSESIVADITRLNRTGRFGRVTSRVQLLTDGSIRLEFIVTLQPVIQDVQVVGNRSISDADIAKVVDLLADTPVDRYRLDRTARAIEKLYVDKGYYRATVTLDEQELAESGIVLFRIQEAQRIRITDIRFDGNHAFTNKQVRPEVRTKESGLFNKGILDYNAIDQDVQSLIRFYENRGHLDIRVGRTITESPNGKEAILTFVIEEGPVYTLRDVKVEYFQTNRPSLGAEQIKGLMAIRPGDVYALNLLTQSITSIRDALGKMGYVDANVIRREFRDGNLPLVDIQVLIQQGNRALTGEITIQGNEITDQRVIRRNFRLRPDRPLDTTAMKNTELLLRNTRLFDPRDNPPKITIQRPNPDDPLYRDILVQVAETNTGNFNFGAQVSSDAGVSARIGLEQRNFDITDWPDSFGEFTSGRAFRGGGQIFKFELLPGTLIQTYLVSLTEPAILDSAYSGSGTLSFNRRIFNEHDRDTAGLRLGAGRRFGERWVGSVSARLETVNIFNIDFDAPVDYFNVEGSSLVDGVGASLTRTTLDNNFRPGKGTRSQVSFEQVGIVGDHTFTRFDASHVVYLTLNEDFTGRRTIASTKARIGYIPQDSSDVPVYERFYMGGQDFRGFGFRTVSPKGLDTLGTQTNDPVGGTWLLFWGAEIEQPIFSDSFSIVTFIDTGTVTNTIGITDYRVAVGFGFRIAIPGLSPVPLAFDFGIPIIKQDQDRDRLFTFTVDLPF